MYSINVRKCFGTLCGKDLHELIYRTTSVDAVMDAEGVQNYTHKKKLERKEKQTDITKFRMYTALLDPPPFLAKEEKSSILGNEKKNKNVFLYIKSQ